MLTDRWPGDLANQRTFINELTDFATDLYRLKAGLPIAEMRKVLEKLFGEKPAGDAVAAYTQRFVDDNLEKKGLFIPGTGTVPALGSLAAPAAARSIPKSTPFGD